MAIDNLPTNDESRLSGAYIRSLVKQLSSAKPTHTNGNLVTNHSIIVGEEYTQSITKNTSSESFDMAKPKNQNVHQGHKKQVRRRLHTCRPYQERLLNMAEARKEIVTALKFHRATMKQANEKKQQQRQLEYQIPHQQQQQQQQSISSLQDFDCHKTKIESQPSFTNTGNAMMDNFSYNSLGNNNSYSSWSISSLPLIEQLPIHESLNIPLPNQTLGLNLNLQAFANLDTYFCHNINTPTSNLKYSSSTPMSPSSSSSSTPRDLIGTISTEGMRPTYLINQAIDMHPSLDEDEMAKIRSIGEQHQIEWDDTLDLVKSAWWLKFIKSKNGNNNNNNNNNNSESPFEELREEFPPWLSANDQSLLQQHLEESCSEGTSLPWVDIGDIDGMDDEWLS